MRFKKITVILILVLSALAISFAIAEYFARRYFPQMTYNLAKERTFAIFQEHENMPFTLKRNVKKYIFTGKTVEFSNTFNTNSYGFRGKEISKEKPANVFRILMLGDSMTLGWGVEEDQTFSYIAEQELNKTAESHNLGIRFEVVNAGFTAGRSLDSYYVYLRDEAFQFNPDLIIINHLPYNDYAPDMMESVWKGQDINGLPQKVKSNFNDIKDGYQVDKYKETWRYEIPFLRNTHSGILFMDALDRYTPNLVKIIRKYVLKAPPRPRLIASGEIAFCLSTLIEKYCPPEMMGLFEKGQPLIIGMKNLATENSSKIAITIIPSLQQIEDLMIHENTELNTKNAEPQRTLTNFLTENNIKSLNFLPFFVSSIWRDHYYQLDWHWNREGHKLAGEKLADFIANEYFPVLNTNKD